MAAVVGKDNDMAVDYMAFMRLPRDRVRRRLLDPLLLDLIEPEGKVVVDLGCGEGYFARAMRQRGAARVFGLDISESLIREARRQDPEGDYRVVDIEGPDTTTSVACDVVVANMVLMNLSDLSLVCDRVRSWLRPHGRFIASITSPHYAFPVGRWKIGIQNVIYATSERCLTIGTYFGARTAMKKYGHAAVRHCHRTMSEYINTARNVDLHLNGLHEPMLVPEQGDELENTVIAAALRKVPLFAVLDFEYRPRSPRLLPVGDARE